jgi:hypothetical protein
MPLHAGTELKTRFVRQKILRSMQILHNWFWSVLEVYSLCL